MPRARLIIPFVAILLLPTSALAHGIGVTCALRGDKVEVEAFYDDDTPAHKAKVKVVNAQEEVIAAGVTDKDGIWTFPTPAPGKYEVRIDAGAGHRAKKMLHVPGEVSATERTTNNESASVPEPQETRETLTRTPWWRIGLGLAIIAAVSAAVIGLMQSRAANQKR